MKYVHGLAARAVFAALLLCAPAMMSAAQAADPAMTVETPGGKVLVDAKGMTLYVFDKDAGGHSMCNGPCATNWPPLMAAAGATAMGKFTIITRDDGHHQWAYNGKPLYTWSKDTKPGDMTGDGFINMWHVARP